MKTFLLAGMLLVSLPGWLQAAPLFETTTVHGMAPDNRPNHRIPALATAPNGDLLLFTEKRNDGIGDIGNHDLVLVRSTDLGRTWSAPQVIFDDGDATATDSTVCIDRERGRIFLFFLRNKSHYHYFTSDDHGHTWQGPVSIHDAVTRPAWEEDRRPTRPTPDRFRQHLYGVGPGAGAIQLTQGPKKGRLLVPARHREYLADGTTASFSHVFFSDDHGATWRLGPTVTRHGNESRLVELSDGSVMMNMRNGNQADQPDNSRRPGARGLQRMKRRPEPRILRGAGRCPEEDHGQQEAKPPAGDRRHGPGQSRVRTGNRRRPANCGPARWCNGGPRRRNRFPGCRRGCRP